MTNTVDYHFTQEGYDALKKELQALVERRPKVVIQVTEAREQGDLSENAGYHAAREELGKIDSRVREIKVLLRLGKVVESSGAAMIDFGSSVVLENGKNKMEYKIVSEFEADPMQGKISDVSPIGRELLGKKAGEFAQISTPSGAVEYKIIEVKR